MEEFRGILTTIVVGISAGRPLWSCWFLGKQQEQNMGESLRESPMEHAPHLEIIANPIPLHKRKTQHRYTATAAHVLKHSSAYLTTCALFLLDYDPGDLWRLMAHLFQTSNSAHPLYCNCESASKAARALMKSELAASSSPTISTCDETCAKFCANACCDSLPVADNARMDTKSFNPKMVYLARMDKTRPRFASVRKTTSDASTKRPVCPWKNPTLEA